MRKKIDLKHSSIFFPEYERYVNSNSTNAQIFYREYLCISCYKLYLRLLLPTKIAAYSNGTCCQENVYRGSTHCLWTQQLNPKVKVQDPMSSSSCWKWLLFHLQLQWQYLHGEQRLSVTNTGELCIMVSNRCDKMAGNLDVQGIYSNFLKMVSETVSRGKLNVWDNEIEQMILVAFYHLEVLVSTIWFASMIRALWVLRWSGTTMHEYSQQRHKALNGVIFIQNVFMQIMFWKCLYYGFCGQGTVKIHCIYWHTKYRKTFSHNRRNTSKVSIVYIS